MKFLEKLAQLFKEEVPVVEQKPVELKKRTKKLVEKKEMVDLGVTSVLLKFQDGRELITKVYGSAVSSLNPGSDEKEYKRYTGGPTELLSVVEPDSSFNLSFSIVNAENYIKSVQNPPSTKGGFTKMSTVYEIQSGNYIHYSDNLIKEEITYVDDPRKPTVSFVGKVISAQIIKTEQCLEEVTKYSVEPI